MSASGLHVHANACTFKDSYFHQEEIAAIAGPALLPPHSLLGPSVGVSSFEGFNPKDELFAIFPP